MKKIAIMGGSFCPPHYSHVDTCKKVFMSCDLDSVWMLPCNNSLYGKKLQEGKHRIEMCRLATQDYKYIEVCDWEIRNNLSGKTLDLAKILIQENPDTEFSFVMGSDSLLKCETWYKWNELRELFHWIVLPRSGYDIPEKSWCDVLPNKILRHVESTDLASSTIKTFLYNKDYSAVKNLLDSRVVDYIIDNELYVNPLV